MATTVGQHGVPAFTNPSNGDALDANVVKGNDNTLRSAYIDHDSDPGVHVQSSAIALRPAPGVSGRKWMTIDGTTTRLFLDDGAAWRELSYLPSPPPATTFTGPVVATQFTALGGNSSFNQVTVNTIIANGPLLMNFSPIHADRIFYTANLVNWTGIINYQLHPTEFITLTGNATVTLTNPGSIGFFSNFSIATIRQDGVGGRTLAFSNVLFPGGITPVQTATASKADVWLFIAKDIATFYGVRLAANL